MLIRNFIHCSDNVKSQLFQSYCSTMYCSAVWSAYRTSSYKSIIVAYNNVFRYLMKVKGQCSISNLFLVNNVDHCKILFRKATFSLLSRVMNSDNVLIQTMTRSQFFLFQSELYDKWQNNLYTV